MIRGLLIPILTVSLLFAADASGEDHLKEMYRYQIDRPGWRYPLKPNREDPVTALSEEEIRSFASGITEGNLILSVVGNCADLAKELECEKMAAPFLKRMAKDFPRVRGNMITRNYQEMVLTIEPVLRAAGEDEEAERLRKLAGY